MTISLSPKDSEDSIIQEGYPAKMNMTLVLLLLLNTVPAVNPDLSGNPGENLSEKRATIPFLAFLPESLKILKWNESASWGSITLPEKASENIKPRFHAECRAAFDDKHFYIMLRGPEAIINGNLEITLKAPGKKLTRVSFHSDDEKNRVFIDGHSPGEANDLIVKRAAGPNKSSLFFAAIPFRFVGCSSINDKDLWKFSIAGNPAATETSTDLIFRKKVFNLGCGGAASGNIMRRFLKYALDLKPDTAVVLAGTNDMINSSNLSDYSIYEKNMRTIVSQLKDAGCRVILVTIPPCEERLLFLRHKPELFMNETPNQRILNANGIIRKVAEDEKAYLLDFFAIVLEKGMNEKKESMIRNPANSGTTDGVHPTEEGYKALAKAAAVIISKNKLAANKVVCLGDSITYGAGMKGAGTASGKTYPGQLLNFLDLMESGETVNKE